MGLTFGNLEFQSKGSHLGLRMGWSERKNLDINRDGLATDRVAATNLKPKKTRALLARMGGGMGQATPQFLGFRNHYMLGAGQVCTHEGYGS